MGDAVTIGGGGDAPATHAEARRPPVLEIASVSRAFGPHTVLQDIRLTIDRGEFVSLVGPSGCGKSTLLFIVGGFTDYRDYTGQVLVDGQPSRFPSWEKGIVFQKNVLYPWLNVLDNIAYGQVLRSLSLTEQVLRPFHYRACWRRYREQAREYLHKMRMQDSDATKMVYEISGGMQQRVDIASALMLRPRILMMDEPFSGLDPQTRAVLQALLRAVHREEGNTVLFVTHDMHEAVYVSTRVVVLSQHHDAGPGARVVMDEPVPFHDSPDPRMEPGFQELVEKIRSAGFSREDQRTLADVGRGPASGAKP
jgi:NitT/TauT family transport system ATP-binding protein